MQDEELLRYSRHILLEGLGIEGQQRICQAHVLLIGAGGLGSVAAMYLAAAGTGTMTLVDPDVVDLTNLQRQIAHRTSSVGMPKAASAQQTLQALNPQVTVHALAQRADSALLGALVPTVDVVLDCTDNFATRHLINVACVAHAKPLVSGAAARWDGQVSVFNHGGAQSPCYACAFPRDATVLDIQCAALGVFGPLVGIIGAMQATEVLKIIIGSAETLSGRMLMLDARAMEFSEVGLARNPRCEVCSCSDADIRPVV